MVYDTLGRRRETVTGIPQFLTSPLVVQVNEGEIIRLPCKVDRLEGFVMLWKKDNNIISVGEQIIDKRIRLESHHDGSTLVMGPASLGDQADYTCQISAYKPVEISHSVVVRVKPVITVTPEKSVVEEGQSVSFQCKVEAGSPTPKVVWKRMYQRLPGGEETIEDTKLSFRKVTRHHSGHYVCEADNGFGISPVTKEVTLEVHHSPHVEDLTSQLLTGGGRQERVMCVLHSHPKATVKWTRNGEPLDINTRGIKIESQANHHSVTVESVEEGYLGQYGCHAANVYGTHSKYIEISGVPKPPTYTSSEISPQRDSYTLSWSTESHTPVDTFRVSYRVASSQEWITTQVSPSTFSTSTSWLGTALLSHLEEATQYQARVQSRNQFGFSKPGPVFHFATKGAVPFHQPSTSSSASSLHSYSFSLLPFLLGLNKSIYL